MRCGEQAWPWERGSHWQKPASTRSPAPVPSQRRWWGAAGCQPPPGEWAVSLRGGRTCVGNPGVLAGQATPSQPRPASLSPPETSGGPRPLCRLLLSPGILSPGNPALATVPTCSPALDMSPLVRLWAAVSAHLPSADAPFGLCCEVPTVESPTFPSSGFSVLRDPGSPAGVDNPSPPLPSRIPSLQAPPAPCTPSALGATGTLDASRIISVCVLSLQGHWGRWIRKHPAELIFAWWSAVTSVHTRSHSASLAVGMCGVGVTPFDVRFVSGPVCCPHTAPGGQGSICPWLPRPVFPHVCQGGEQSAGLKPLLHGSFSRTA